MQKVKGHIFCSLALTHHWERDNGLDEFQQIRSVAVKFRETGHMYSAFFDTFMGVCKR